MRPVRAVIGAMPRTSRARIVCTTLPDVTRIDRAGVALTVRGRMCAATRIRAWGQHWVRTWSQTEHRARRVTPACISMKVRNQAQSTGACRV